MRKKKKKMIKISKTVKYSFIIIKLKNILYGITDSDEKEGAIKFRSDNVDEKQESDDDKMS